MYASTVGVQSILPAHPPLFLAVGLCGVVQLTLGRRRSTTCLFKKDEPEGRRDGWHERVKDGSEEVMQVREFFVYL